jgi:hypothetical protein
MCLKVRVCAVRFDGGCALFEILNGRCHSNEHISAAFSEYSHLKRNPGAPDAFFPRCMEKRFNGSDGRLTTCRAMLVPSRIIFDNLVESAGVLTGMFWEGHTAGNGSRPDARFVASAG